VSDSKLKVGIVGPGGIGGLLAILLSNKNTKVICNNSKIDNKKFNFKLQSKIYGNKIKKIEFSNKKLKFFDIIFISVKYQNLKKAIEKIDTKTNKIIVPLLNGLSHIDILKKKFAQKIVVANIGKTIAYKTKRNLVIHESKNYPEINISLENKTKLKEINFLIKTLKNIKIKVNTDNLDNKVIWTKLIRINTLSAVTALHNSNLGEIRNSNYKKEQLNSILKETILVAKAKGLKFKLKDVMKEIDSFPDTLTTSMQRDIANNKKSEIESILGGVLYEAKKENLILKINKKVYKLLKKK
tara:strand:+ start:1001 stop:1894 length:894 start_codon:yes stop_codon:yes gene_type:complete